MAHALTGLRLFLTAPLVYWLVHGDPGAAWLIAAAIGLAIATDLLDGPIARLTGRDSAAGRAFDHGADFVFVTSGLAALAWRGDVPWALPLLIAVAFAQYVVDSYWLHARRELRMSGLGRWNGILYFVPLCGHALALLGLVELHAPVRWLSWLLVATTLLSIGDRLLAVTPGRRSRDSRV